MFRYNVKIGDGGQQVAPAGRAVDRAQGGAASTRIAAKRTCCAAGPYGKGPLAPTHREVAVMTFTNQLIRLLAMQMPCRLFCSAWHLFWRSNCSDIY
jgi:hypothetical protein